MDNRERFTDEEETQRMAFESQQAGLWTALPVLVDSFNPALQTCSLQPLIKCRVRAPDGTFSYVQLPLLLDCPVVFPSGGGFTLTLPVSKGDEGIALFSSRCIDAWWQSGGVQNPAEVRMHDLSDGFYLPGVRSNPRALGGVSTGTAQLRSDDGSTFIEVAGGGVVNITAPTQINLNSPLVTVQGRIDVQNIDGVASPCNVNGDVIASGVSLVHHTHNGVQSGSGNTGPPN